MVEYDDGVIKEHAQRLYDQSRYTTMRHFLIGIFAGMLIFGALSDALLASYDALIISIGTLIGGVMGYGSGQNRSFEQRLQAQQALCQAKIQENTK